ncbi:ABC transporter substrate-binding protein [Chitinivorax sp. B]|uniref:ABC transporter substrate-binding protein n=1 Tax=Chitinivorax sp. B TaxID=2502235 RepID=UPI0010F653FC|nr:ABC transporter substrate-binding protein [Chitinivorax sp. B]
MKICPACQLTYENADFCPVDGAALIERNQTDSWLGQIIKDSYRLEQIISSGPMSVVYLARQLALDRLIVVKMLRPGNADVDGMQLFFREARIASQLNHPNVIQILDFGGLPDGAAFLAIEYLHGETLSQIVEQRGGLTLENIVWVMEQTCAGLSAMHQQQIVHRDIKPSNIMVARISGDSTVVKLLDFGISKPLHEQDLGFTRSGAVMGTPGYLAPEQINGASHIDQRADIYALGAVLFFLITGQRPYEGESGQQIMANQLAGSPTPLASIPVPDFRNLALEPVIRKAMLLVPEQRFADTQSLMEQLRTAANATKLAHMPSQSAIETFSQYQFVFSGELFPDTDVAEAQTRLRQQFSLTKDQSDALFSGKRLVIKKEIDLATAQRYEQLFNEAGAVGHIEEMSDATRIVPTRSRDDMSLSQPITLPKSVLPMSGQATGSNSMHPSRPTGTHSRTPAVIVVTGQPVKATQSNRRVWPYVLLFLITITAGSLAIPAVRYRATDWITHLQGIPHPRGITRDQIILGMSAPFSGPARELGRTLELGIKTRLKEINDNGGINGRDVVLRSLNDSYEPAQAKINVGKLLAPDGAFALIGNVGTPTTSAVLPLVLQQKTLLFGPLSGSDQFRQDPADRYVFNYRASYGEETEAIVKYFVQERNIAPNRIAAFIQNDDFGRDGLDGIIDALRSFNIKHTDLRIASYERNSTQFDDAIGHMLPYINDIEGIVIVGTYLASARFTAAMRKAGFKGTIANVSFVDSAALAEEFKAIGGQYGEGVIISQVVPMPNSFADGVLRYRNALQKYYPSESPSHVSLEGYVATSILCEALQQAGRKLDTEEVIGELEKIKGLDIGIGTTLSFSPSDHQGSHRIWGTMLNRDGSLTAVKLTHNEHI